MKKPKAALLLLIIAAVFVHSLTYGATSGATSGADFLKIPKSARAIGLGDSYTAVIGDATAIEYNPAAMNLIENFAVSMMYQSWIDTTYALYVSAAVKHYGFVFGGSVFFVNYNGLTSYDLFGAAMGEYHPFDLNVKAAMSLDGGMLIPALTGFSLGATVSMIERSLVEDNSVGFTFDLGANYQTSMGRLQIVQDGHFAHIPIYLGLSVQNLGYSASAITPVKVTFGIATEIVSNLLVSIDTSVEYGRPFLYKMGIEYTLWNVLTLRTGFNLGRDTGNLSFGVGLRYPKYFRDLRFDYAFSYMGVLGNNHNFSIYADFPIFKDKVESLYQRGIYHYVRGEFELARQCWEQALSLDPENKMIKKKLEELDRFEELSQMIDE